MKISKRMLTILLDMLLVFTTFIGINAVNWSSHDSLHSIYYRDSGRNHSTSVSYRYGSSQKALIYDGGEWLDYSEPASAGKTSYISTHTARGHRHAVGTSQYNRQLEK